MFSQQRPRFSSFGSKTYLRFALIFNSTKSICQRKYQKIQKLPQFSPHDSFSAGKKLTHMRKKCNSYYHFAIPDHKVYTSCGSIANICWCFYQMYILNSDILNTKKNICNWTFEWGIRISSHQLMILYFQNIHQTKWI